MVVYERILFAEIESASERYLPKMFVEEFDEEEVEFLSIGFIRRHEIGVETDDKHGFMGDPKDS